jgi:hypothetical protein
VRRFAFAPLAAARAVVMQVRLRQDFEDFRIDATGLQDIHSHVVMQRHQYGWLQRGGCLALAVAAAVGVFCFMARPCGVVAKSAMPPDS